MYSKTRKNTAFLALGSNTLKEICNNVLKCFVETVQLIFGKLLISLLVCYIIKKPRRREIFSAALFLFVYFSLFFAARFQISIVRCTLFG